MANVSRETIACGRSDCSEDTRSHSPDARKCNSDTMISHLYASAASPQPCGAIFQKQRHTSHKPCNRQAPLKRIRMPPRASTPDSEISCPKQANLQLSAIVWLVRILLDASKRIQKIGLADVLWGPPVAFLRFSRASQVRNLLELARSRGPNPDANFKQAG